MASGAEFSILRPSGTVKVEYVYEDRNNFLDFSKWDLCPYICYSVDTTSEEIFMEKLSLS